MTTPSNIIVKRCLAGTAALLAVLGAEACAGKPAGITQELTGGRTDGLADLEIQVDVKILKGRIMLALYDSEAAYNGGPAVAGVAGEADESPVVISVKDLKPGTYAIKGYHDLDGDGKMNTNAFGIPSEPYGFSNNAPGNFGPPPFEKAAFEVTAGGTVHKMAIK